MALSSPVTGGSGGFTSIDEELAYYKSQYEHLESELQEFQASSRELETELERDIEASEKRERHLKEKVEALAFEVEEWKTKCKQSKTEANHAQTALQKEITTLRDANRTLVLKLRDIEVANDDYERQARNTTSSLEDLESKYNVSIERGVMLEEEIKVGEQERETIRIENQRLRDDLSDLKIEAEIVQEKLRLAESALQKHHISPIRASRSTLQDNLRPQSPASVASISITSLSSPLDPSPVMDRRDISASTPPSPPLSDPSSMNGIVIPKTPTAGRSHSVAKSSLQPPNSASSATFPGWRPNMSTSRHARTFSSSTTSTIHSMSGPTARVPGSAVRRPSTSRTAVTPTNGRHATAQSAGLPRSGSLHQIRGLIGKMQKLEERVHNARLKLPASSQPTTVSDAATAMAANVTMRSPRKRQSFGVSVSGTNTPSGRKSIGPVRSTTSALAMSRSGGVTPVREPSVASVTTSVGTASRPASRASGLSKSTMGVPPPYVRPGSQSTNYSASRPTRTSANAGPVSAADIRRPRSSVSGVIRPSVVTSGSVTSSSTAPSPTSQYTPGHIYSRSITCLPGTNTAASSPLDRMSSSTSRRTTLDYNNNNGFVGEPEPKRPVFPHTGSGAGTPNSSRRKSSALPVVRRQSSAAYGPDFGSPSKVPAPPVPPLPPNADSMATFSAGSTPGRPSSRMTVGRVRAPTVSSTASSSGFASAGGGVGLSNQAGEPFGDIGETF